MTDLSRRTTMGLSLAAGAAAIARGARAQTPSEVKIAMLVPLGTPGHPGADGRPPRH
jgi:hypothetical protein